MIRARRIIIDSIKDRLIPQVSSKGTPKEMFDSLYRMYEGININQKMNLRAQLKTLQQELDLASDFSVIFSQFW